MAFKVYISIEFSNYVLFYILSSWIWNAAKNDMFDYVPVITDRMVLAIMKHAIPKGTWDLSRRPFVMDSWLVIALTTVALCMILLGLSCTGKFLTNEAQILSKSYKFLESSIMRKKAKILARSHRFVLFIAWTCFLLIKAYYEGALIMFFATKVGIPFESIKDVMRAYPGWRLMMRSGNEAYYIDHVDSGDADYIKFWERVNKTPEETTFSGIEEVIERYNHDPVVVHELQGAIDSYQKYGKGDTMDHLEVFYQGRAEWYGIIVTENSPLGPMMRYGAKILHERGVFDYLKAQWLGGEKTCRGSVHETSSSTAAITLNQMTLVFSVFGLLMIFAFVMFLGELLKKYQEERCLTAI